MTLPPSPATPGPAGPAPESGADVAVIVVNYGTADLALQAVDSVLAGDHGGLGVEVHLVDNASPGADAAHLARALEDPGRAGRVAFYPETVNHGFGRGNNLVLHALAARARPPRFVLLLNPDARLEPGALGMLAAFLDARPGVAVAGAAIAGPDGAPRVAAFRFPGIVSEFAGGAQFGPLDQLTARWAVPLPHATEPRPVDWVSGAAFMARLDALEAAGFFDDAFFLYFEEVELMHRLRRAGWEIWQVPGARVIHAEGAATGLSEGRRAPMPGYWFDSWRLYFTRTRGPWGARACALARLAGSALHLVLSRLRRRPPRQAARFVPDFARRALRPLWRGEAT